MDLVKQVAPLRNGELVSSLTCSAWHCFAAWHHFQSIYVMPTCQLQIYKLWLIHQVVYTHIHPQCDDLPLYDLPLNGQQIAQRFTNPGLTFLLSSWLGRSHQPSSAFCLGTRLEVLEKAADLPGICVIQSYWNRQ